MSVCNYTQYISPNDCVGDSLGTINANFSALDEGLCSVPDVVGGAGVRVVLGVTEQTHNYVQVSTKNSYVYSTTFEYKKEAYENTLNLSDSSSINVTTFPGNKDSVAAFTTIALTDIAPKVSLLWTAEGRDNLTVFLTNSSTSEVDNNSPIAFNGPVTSLLSADNVLYVGGEFTTVSGINCSKFCAVDISNPFGSLIGNPLSGSGGLGAEGTVNCIASYKTNSVNLLIIGGSFKSFAKGRGLLIYDQITKSFYPFYVNGTVNELQIIGSDLYVGGEFDCINYGPQVASTFSNYRVYTNSLIKISLDLIEGGYPNSSIDKDFAEHIQQLFVGPAVIYAMAKTAATLYVGGSFDIKNGSMLYSRNLAIITNDGHQETGWKPIIDGNVHSLSMDEDSFLYVGGDFKNYYTAAEYYASPRKNDGTESCNNAICFDCNDPVIPQLQTNWKPEFNGTVTKFEFRNTSTGMGEHVYCYGKFTKVNSTSVNYITALSKANEGSAATERQWNVRLQTPPGINSKSLLIYSNSVIIGGTFSRINNNNISYLARVNVSGTETIGSLSAVTWGLNSQICSPGMSLVNSSNTITVSGYPGPEESVNETTFSLTDQHYNHVAEGTLLKFQIKRLGTEDEFKSDVHVIGWKVDFN